MPHMLWERATANTADVFLAMEKFTSGGGMLALQPGSYLRRWQWREDKINLIGAMQPSTVRVRYEKILPLLVLGTDPVKIRSATDELGFATAALAARSRGARAGCRLARLRANRCGKPDQSLCASGADERAPPHAQRISQAHYLFIDERCS